MTKKEELIDLDTCVLNALELFKKEKLPKLSLGKFTRPLVIGSGNAAATGRVLFTDKDAVFADEGTYKKKLKTIKAIDGAVLISASGGKHAPIIAKVLEKKKLRTVLLTNTENAPAAKFVNKTLVFPKNSEPYTYNTSTYMGMILAKTKENPATILRHLKKLKIPKNLKKYNAFLIIVPEEFDEMREFLHTKFDELFGPRMRGEAFTFEQVKHAKTVIPSDKELFISFGVKNTVFGTHRLYVSLPENASYAAFMATAYYVIGNIQKQHPQYFKKNIVAYTKTASKIFGHIITPLVKK